MLEILWPGHLMPSSHQPQGNYQADRDPIPEESSNSDADDRATLAEILKGKAGGAESSGRGAALGEDVVTSCPKGLRTTVRKQKANVASRPVSIMWYRNTQNVICW